MPADDIPSLASLRRSQRSLFDPPPAKAPAKPEAPTPPEAPKIWTVSALVRSARSLIERSFPTIWVEGEISNWRPAASGHCYFTLKDRDAQLNIVLFRREASALTFVPRDGDSVRIRGQLSIFDARGQMQLIADTMEPLGLGAMLAALQQLKDRLRREGIFANQRPLPAFPRCIGVITSLHGAALRDIVKVCRRQIGSPGARPSRDGVIRHAAVNLLIYPAAVQGANCSREVTAGLRWFAAHSGKADVILVARGGGSFEDLHGFNHEAVARAIHASPIPVITGIGHATDSVLADAAADLCAPTPSAAAELLTAHQHQVESRLSRLEQRLLRVLSFHQLRAQQRLAHLSTRLQHQHPLARLARNQRRLTVASTRLETLRTRHFNTLQQRLDSASTRLEAISPYRVLDRGYALVYGPTGIILRAPADAPPGTAIVAQLSGGSIHAFTTATPVPSLTTLRTAGTS